MEQQEDQTGVTLQGPSCPGEGTLPAAQLLPRTYPLTEPISPILPRDPPWDDDDVVGPILRDPKYRPGTTRSSY